MTTAWRGIEEEWTNEEKAAHILALGFGYGSCWTRDYEFAKPTTWRAGAAGDESSPAATNGLHIARETETLELASRAIHPKEKKQPEWVKTLSASERAKALAWSAEHSLSIESNGARRVREFEHWKTITSKVCVPHVRSGADVSAALAMAHLPGPLLPLLLLYALEDRRQVEAVLRYACACGARPEIVRDALVRLLLPAMVPRGQAKPSIRMRASEYRKQLHETSARLERWLRDAAAEFLRAYNVRIRPGTSSLPEDGVTSREIRAATRSPTRRRAA